MNNIEAFLTQKLKTYTQEELFGIFFMGRRVSSFTNKHIWTSHANAKKALHYMINYYKKIDWEVGWYKQFNISNKEAKEFFDVNKLLADKVFEIREVGNT